MENDALKEFYSVYRKELYLYIYSMCRNRELAEDICQETFLKAILSLSSQHSNPRAWLYLVARNLCLNSLRKEKSRVDIECVKEQGSADTDVIEKIILLDKKRRLYEALQSIDERKREVLMLQFFSGLSQKEIASVMNLTPENVRILGYRGKQEIKKIMEANDYDI